MFGNAFSYYGLVLLTTELNKGDENCNPTVVHLQNSADIDYKNVFIATLAGERREQVETTEDNAKAINVSEKSKSMGLEDIINLEDDSDFEQENESSETTNAGGDANIVGTATEMNVEDESAFLSDLSISLEKCFQSNVQKRKKTSDHDKSQEQSCGSSEFKPFNYAAAIRFWKNPDKEKKVDPDDKRAGSGDSTGRRSSDGCLSKRRA